VAIEVTMPGRERVPVHPQDHRKEPANATTAQAVSRSANQRSPLPSAEAARRARTALIPATKPAAKLSRKG
jgi:hypothetical protein